MFFRDFRSVADGTCQVWHQWGKVRCTKPAAYVMVSQAQQAPDEMVGAIEICKWCWQPLAQLTPHLKFRYHQIIGEN
jgi:hypothetical protein